MMKRMTLALVSSCAVSAVSLCASAQTIGSETDGIQEIIVTAQKRAENMQDTPISIVAMNAETLEKQGINSLNDMFTGSVPSLRVAPFIGRASAVSIGMRGLVPLDVTQVTRDPTVGIYIDGVYLGRVSGLGMDLADIERIEVLRGPQGTLFGRNTIGGAVSVVSKKPTGEFGVDLKGGLGNFSDRSLSAHINLPKVAGISVKVDGLFNKRSGLVHNPMTSAKDYGAIEKYGIKTTALWEATDNFSILYSFDYSKDNSTGNYYYIFKTQQSAAVTPSFITVGSPRVRTAPVGLPNFENPQKAQGHSIVANFDASDHLTIRSLTSWRRLNSVQWEQDNGGLTRWGAGRLFGRLSYAKVNQHQFSEELQIIGNINNFKYVGGLYFFDEKGRDTATVYSSGTLNSTVSGINLFSQLVADAGLAIPDRASAAKVRSTAAFGQATWSPMGDLGLHLTAGARYTKDKKSGQLVYLRGVDPHLNFQFRSSRVDPSAVIAYDFTKDINAYVKWGRAYRAGGANTRSVALAPFGEEELTSWEIGAKSDLFDRRLRLNIAAYKSTLSNQQVDFANPLFISNTETKNAPEKRHIKGIEADITVVPFSGLTVNANYVYTKAPTTPVINPYTGGTEFITSAYTPTHAYTANFDYNFPKWSFGQLRAHVDINSAGGYVSNNTPSNDNTKNGKTLLTNARLSLADIKISQAEMELSVWGKNLFNNTYQLFDVTIAGRNTHGMYNEQRTWGVEARIKF
ncbi:TonB-dependent receptor [Aquisediminimonas sediminicola]|uniref:TonB-dependent receptor n=1 Tax=Alteraquisediminimonas sediminicola TaxID=2676787 RepID=UPI001C8D5944|nr:TonB-dependent receptor [Aquisediminimonas sediminicola]